MEIKYRQAFIRDMKQLRKQHKQMLYDEIYKLAFTQLVAANSLKEITGIKPMTGYPNRYRIRINDYRVGIELHGNTIEMMRVLHRSEFYRYFP